MIQIYNFGISPLDFSISPNPLLLANVGDKIKVEFDVHVSTRAIASSGLPLILNCTDGYIGDGWVVGSAAQFKDFNIGDTVLWGNYVTETALDTFTIADKSGDNAIQLTGGTLTGGDDFESTQSAFSVTVPITGFKYQYNFIENSEAPNYFSKIDGSEIILMRSDVDASDTTPLDMIFLGNKDYQIGSATVEGIEIQNDFIYVSKFKVTHYTEVTPYILARINSFTQELEYDSLVNNINPEFWINSKCLKFIYKVEASYEYSDPNRVQKIEQTSIQGNSGGWGENFNTGLTNYMVSTVLKDISSTTIPSLQLTTDKQSFEITITNTTDTPFNAFSSLASVNFVKVPSSSTEYQMTGRTLYQNFVRDKAANFVGAGATNGDNNGTDYQVFKNVTVTYVSSSIIKIQGDIYFGAEALNRLNESDEPRYILWITTADAALSSEVSDRVNKIASIDDFYVNISAPGLIVNTNTFIRHPEDNFDIAGQSEIAVFSYDEVVARSQFYIDRAAYPSNEVTLKTLRGKIKIKNSSTGAEFTLDTFTMNMNGLGLDSSGYQYVNVSYPRAFHIPSTEQRKNIVVKRRGDLDTSDQFYYDFIFPVMIRWEYWEVLAAVNSAFFNTSESNNGYNQDWNRYSDESISANWKMYYEFRATFDFDGTNLSYEDEAQIYNADQNLPAKPWVFESIKSYDPDTLDELYDPVDMKKFILGYKNTLIVAKFKNNEGFTSSNINVCSSIETYEEGGIASRRRLSSIQPMSSDTWFKGITDVTLIDLDFGTTDYVIASFLVDYTQIPLNKFKYTIAARLYDISAGLLGGKITEDGIAKITEDLIPKIIE